MRTGLLFSIALVAALAACGPTVKQVEQKPLADVSGREDLKRIRYDRTVVDLRRGTPIGGFRTVLLACDLSLETLSWGAGRFTERDGEFDDLFFHEMAAAGYRVVGDPRTLFPDEHQERAPYAVAARIDKIELSLCHAVSPLWGVRLGGVSGDAYVSVNWQVQDTLDKTVVLDLRTEGSFTNDNASPDGALVALQGAYSRAVANLAADPRFQTLVAERIPGQERDRRSKTAASAPALELPRLAPFTGPITSRMDLVRRATVTIAEDRGHGSGVFVGKDGHILTNRHVVGDAKFVTVRLYNGREITGEVVRSHPHRDVALVLVEEKGYPALPIRPTPLGVGEEVYAVGSPLSKAMSTTVSKGIVSAFRHEDGLEMIQADVATHGGNSGGPLLDGQGNLAGLTVAGYAANDSKMGVGLNFFIPIHDGLDKLNIGLAAPRGR